MRKEYGSEFWLEDNRLEKIRPPYFLTPKEILLSSGRGAISYLLDSLPFLPKKVLLPNYTCESVVSPFVKRGFRMFYYQINKKMEPDLEDIVNLMGHESSILLHMGYFGFQTNIKINEIEDALTSAGCFFIEDATHTIFNDQRLVKSDCVIASVRKWLGVPSGGFIDPKEYADYFDKKLTSFDSFCSERFQSLKDKRGYMETHLPELKVAFSSGFKKAEALLDSDDTAYVIDRVSSDILYNLRKDALKKARKSNFTYLSKNIPFNELFKPMFDGLPSGVCPFFFPVYVASQERRDVLQKALASSGLYCPIHWPKNKYNDSLGEVGRYIYEHILSFPCDQRYNEVDMASIITIIKKNLFL